MRSRGPAFARPVGLRPGCPDREVDLLCSRTSVGPRRVRRLPALRAAAGLPQPARRSHRRPPPRPPGPSALRLPASPPPGCPDGPTFVVGVHRTPCPVPSPPRSPAASSSEVALRRTRWSCSVLSRCERAGPLTLRLPASSATGCPAACFAFLDCLPLRPARRRPGLPGRRRRSCLRWPTLVLGGPRRSSPGRSVGWSPSSPPSGVSSGWPAVSLCGGVVLCLFRQGAQGVSAKFSDEFLCPQDVHRVCGGHAPDVPTLSPASCTAPSVPAFAMKGAFVAKSATKSAFIDGGRAAWPAWARQDRRRRRQR